MDDATYDRLAAAMEDRLDEAARGLDALDALVAKADALLDRVAARRWRLLRNRRLLARSRRLRADARALSRQLDAIIAANAADLREMRNG